MRNDYINNPIQYVSPSSLEREEFKEHNKINTLLKLNIHKIIRNKERNKSFNIICVNGKMYYRN